MADVMGSCDICGRENTPVAKYRDAAYHPTRGWSDAVLCRVCRRMYNDVTTEDHAYPRGKRARDIWILFDLLQTGADAEKLD